MRKKIWRMSEDRFQSDSFRPDIKFNQDSLELDAVEREPFEGSFTVSSGDDEEIRGMVFSSNPYVAVKNPSFEGKKAEVFFSLINSGCRDGDVVSGSFHVISSRFTKDLPFTITFRGKEFSCNGTVIKTPEDFCGLYRERPSEALSWFRTADFREFAKKQGTEFYLLYKGYMSFPPTIENLEEFLIGAGLKSRVGFSLRDTSLSYTVSGDDVRETVEIEKTAWGNIRLTAQSDSDFITVGHESITDDFFVGTSMQFDFYIHPARMHAGKNYARITFSGCGTKKTLSILCRNSQEKTSSDKDDVKRIVSRARREITENYLLYRLGSIGPGEWCDREIPLLDTISEVLPRESSLCMLMKTHCLIINKRRQDALLNIEFLKREIVDKKSREWAYLLYLCTMIENEKSYVDRLTAETETIFRETDDDPVVFWLLLFLREEYVGNALLELSDIRQFVMNGCDSPFLYVEAEKLIEKDPLLIRSFDPFSVKILRWSARKMRLTGNIAMRIAALLKEERAFDKKVFSIAEQAYASHPSSELLEQILSYLLRNAVYGPAYFPWYALALKADLSLTGLYEGYVLSAPDDFVKALPEELYRYFGYSNTIGHDRKAFVFANLILHKEDHAAIYRDTMRTVETFALEMMRRQRIDDNLAIIYQDILDRGIIDADVSAMMAKLLYPTRIICMPKNVSRVVLIEESRTEPVAASVTSGRAFLPLRCREHRVFLETEGGIFVSDKGFVLEEPLLKLRRILPRLISEAKDVLPYFTLAIDEAEDRESVPSYDGHDTADLIEGFLNDGSLRRSYKTKKYRLLIDYLRYNMREDVFENYLISETDYSYLDTKTIAYVTDLFVISGDYDKAYPIIRNFYGISVTGKSLLTLVTYMIEKNPKEADDFLVSMSAYLMKKLLTNETTVAYLGRFFVGPGNDMATLWKHLSALELPTEEVGERLVTEALYTEEFPEESELIFESYLNGRPNRMIAEAWFTYWAHAFVRDKSPAFESVFAHLQRYADLDEKLNESCLVALLKHYCNKDSLSASEMKTLDRQLSSAIRKNLYFSFYRNAPESLQIKYHLYDKYFVTYQGEEGQRVNIRLKNDEMGKIEAEMVEMYPGIYVSQFVLFFGDRSDYEIYLRDEPEHIITDGEISCTDDNGGRSQSRYALINRMRSSLVYFDDREVTDAMKRYKRLLSAADGLFELR